MGTVYSLYNNEVASWAGYNENERINDPEYQPGSKADKGFFLEFIEKETAEDGNSTGLTEWSTLKVFLNVLYRYPVKSSKFSENEAATWNAIDLAERELLDFAGTRGEVLLFERIVLTKQENRPQFRLAIFEMSLKIQRSITV
jgi:hypothetical protein